MARHISQPDKNRKTGFSRTSKIDLIESEMKTDIICSNANRVAILNILKNAPGNEMQVERIAKALGISHRTAIYHLDILREYELVDVKRLMKRGQKFLRSVWALNTGNSEARKMLELISKRFPTEKENGFWK
ncbi:MAG: winged helix-turn-helix domain-containing protein [Candidatus Aenigmatarchaeota archaeon]